MLFVAPDNVIRPANLEADGAGLSGIWEGLQDENIPNIRCLPFDTNTYMNPRLSAREGPLFSARRIDLRACAPTYGGI